MSVSSWLVVALGLVLALPVGWRVVTRRFDIFEPFVIFAVAYGVVFVVKPISMLLHGQLDSFGVDIRSTFPRALLLALVGGASFVVSYELGVGRALAGRLPKPRDLTTRAGVTGAAIFVGLALVSLAIMVWPAGGLRRFTVLLHGKSPETQRLVEAKGGYFFSLATLLVPAAIVLVAVAARDRRTRLSVAAAVASAMALLVMIPLGARSYLLPLLGGGLTFAYVRRGVRPRPATVAALAVVAILASYTLTVIRAPDQRAHLGATMLHLATRPDTAFHFLVHGEDAEMASVFAAELRVIPSKLHYRYGGATLVDLVTRPIPRQLWSGKPRPVEDQLVGAVWPRLLKAGFNPAFSLILFFYWDFGIAGVAIGMCLFGLACRVLYEWFLRHRDSLVAQLIFATAVWYVVLGVRNNPVDTIAAASFIVLPVILLERLPAILRRSEQQPYPALSPPVAEVIDSVRQGS